MTLLFTDGFENLTDNAWTTFGTPAIGPARTNNGLIFDGADRVGKALPSHPTTITTGFAYKMEPFTANGKGIVNLDGGTDFLAYLWIYADGHVAYTRGVSTLLQASAPGVIRPGQWHFIELTMVLSLAGGVIRVRVDGVDVINAVGQATLTPGMTAYCDFFRLRNGTADGVVSSFDDLYVRNDQTMTGDAIIVPPSIPTAPTGLGAVQSGSDIVLTWTPPAPLLPPITANKIERAPNSAGAPGTWATLATIGNVSTYTDPLNTTGTYWYRVSTTNDLGTGPPSAAVSATIAPLPKVTGLTATVTGVSDVTLQWTAVTASPPVTGYQIDRAPDAGGAPGAWSSLGTVGTVLTFVETIGPGIYWYRVSAISSLGTGPPGDPVTVFVPPRGCPFGDDYPGWRLFVESYFDKGRTYGALNYGDQEYGGSGSGPQWYDITHPTFSLTVTAGGTDAAPVIPVNEFRLEVVDDAGAWWDFAAPARFNLPTVASPIRYGLVDGGGHYFPLGTGSVESVVDEHDHLPRSVEIVAFGNLSSLVNSLSAWQRPAETANARITAIIARAGAIDWTAPAGPALTADVDVKTIVARDELDRTALSAGWYMLEDRAGDLHFRQWPHVATGETLTVTDCLAEPGDLLAASISFVADTGAVLNAVILASDSDPPLSYESVDTFSIERFGRRTEALGFPLTDLAFSTVAAAQAIADRTRDRYKTIVNRVDAIEVDSANDHDWLGVLATLDVGRPIHVHRRGIRPYELDTIVVGYEMRLEPNRIAATISVTTLTTTT